MKILIVQTSFLGDTILSTPVISGIKKIHPDSELYMMTTSLSSSLVRRDPMLDGVISYNKHNNDSGITGFIRLKKKIESMGFDKVYSLHRSYRTSMLLAISGIPERIGFDNARLNVFYHRTYRRRPEDHDVIRNLSILSGDIPLNELDGELRLFSPGIDELSMNIRTVFHGPGDYAVLVPGSAWPTKIWDWKGFREVARYLKEKGIKVFLIGSVSDKKISARVSDGMDIMDLTGNTTIDDAMYIIKNARLIVCNDSMSLHMASAFKTPTVAIFCATSPKFGFGPWKNNGIVVEKDIPCRPCSRHGTRKCPNGSESCMKDLSNDDVIAAIEDLDAF